MRRGGSGEAHREDPGVAGGDPGEADGGGKGRPAPGRAEAPEGSAAGEAVRGLLTVRLGDARFGAWVDEVLEIVDAPPISRLPLARREVVGVTSVRGDIIPVVDLGLRLLGAPATRPGRLLLVRHEDSGAIVGLLVDAVETLLPVQPEAVLEPPAAVESKLPAEYVTGVVTSDDAVVAVLHLGRATAPPDPSTDED